MSETEEGPDSALKRFQKYLDQVANDLGISSPKYTGELGTKAGDNYIGEVYRVSIEGEKDGSPVKLETIFKVPPKDEILRKMLQIEVFFGREHTFYSKIVPVFKEFLQTKNKSLENIPQCYLSSAVAPEEIICLEDLRLKGFVMRDRLKQMDFPHASLALRTLGRFHALSFALRDQRPEVFTEIITPLKAVLYRPDILADAGFIEHYNKYASVAKTALAEDDPKYTERFTAFSKDALNNISWSCDGNNAEPYAVLCHGDFWMNNMLFKYEEGSLEPQDIRLLDFQLTSFASPVVDISYILFCNCSQELRKNHFDYLIKIYYKSLSDYLTELGSDPKKLFPYDALLNQLEKFSINGAGMAVLVLPAFTTQGDDDKRVSVKTDLSGLDERMKRDHFWRNTTRETFKDLIDRNFI